jgi:hypothetical protein
MSKKIVSSIGEVIANDPAFHKVRDVLEREEVFEHFFLIFPELAGHVLPDKYDSGVLKIKVDNPALKNELKFSEELLINKMNTHFKCEKIKQIKFSR